MEITESLLRHGFTLLASAQLGSECTWTGPESLEWLRERVRLLALLQNIVPRSKLDRLDEILADWVTAFPAGTLVDAAALRMRTLTYLGPRAFPGSQSDAFRQQIAALFEVSLPNPTSKSWQLEVRTKAAQCVMAWVEHTRTSPEWKELPHVVPGRASVPISTAYVELYATAKGPTHAFIGSETRVRALPNDALLSLATAISRVARCGLILGEPGSGKSTIVQWLVWATTQKKMRDFDFAFAVRLREFAAELKRGNKGSLLHFLMRQVDAASTEEMAECVREMAQQSRRFLFLVDGWDEVPSEFQTTVREAIRYESSTFVMIVTSRLSGHPWSIFGSEGAECYQIAGLSESAVEEYVTKQLSQLGKEELKEFVLGRIQKDDLRGAASNPFLLGLIVQLVAHNPHSLQTTTLCGLLAQLVAWLVEQHNQLVPHTAQLQGSHLKTLERLAFKLTFRDGSPRYVFRHGE